MRARSFLLLLFLPFALLAQRSVHGSAGLIMPRDKIKLRNGDAETGRVISSDSTMIMLRKYDYSEKRIPRSDIDTILGLSWFTYFISPSLGPGHWNGMISERLDTFNTGAFMLSVKMGTMRKKRWAFYIDLNHQGGRSFGLWHAGAGLRFYFPLDYVRKNSTYIGFNYGYNIPTTNVNRFRDFGFNLGYEFRIRNKHRFFAEYYHMTCQKFTPQPSGGSLQFGMRFSMEYADRYYRLNHKLPLDIKQEPKKVRTEF